MRSPRLGGAESARRARLKAIIVHEANARGIEAIVWQVKCNAFREQWHEVTFTAHSGRVMNNGVHEHTIGAHYADEPALDVWGRALTYVRGVTTAPCGEYCLCRVPMPTYTMWDDKRSGCHQTS